MPSSPVIRAKSPNTPSSPHDQKRLNAMIVLVLTLAIIAVGGWFIIHPLIMRYAELNERTLPELEFRRNRFDGFLSLARNIDKQMKQVSPSDRIGLEEALPETFDVPDIVANIEAIAALSGLKPEAVSVTVVPVQPNGDDGSGEAPLPPGTMAATVTVKVSGVNYLTLKEFLNKIETNSRLLDLPEFLFNPQNESMQVNLMTYAFKAP